MIGRPKAKISVVLPVYNGGRSVADAIASIRAQTFHDWELIVIDDGSTDETPRLLATVATQEPRIVVERGPRSGIVAALNRGIALASGDYIARMDADDIAMADRLAAQVELLEAQPEIGLASCFVEFGGDRLANQGYALHVDWLNRLVTPEEIALNRFVESPLAHPSVVFRRDLVARFGGYADGDFPEDYELWLRWMDGGVKMAKVPRPLLRWNDAPARLSRTDPRYAPEAFYRTKAKYIARELARSAAGRGIWVWGAGRPTRKRAAYLRPHGVAIAGYIDIDPKKAGARVDGVPVVLPTALPSPSAAFVLGYVGTRGARDLIRGELTGRGYVEGRDFLMCA